MSSDYILIGARKNDSYKSKHEVAHHAMHIDTLIKAYKNGIKEHIPYSSKSENPGVDLVNHINDNHPNCEGIVLGQKLQYANNLKKGVSIKAEGGIDIDHVVGRYTSGKLYGLKTKPERKETPYKNSPRDARGGGVRDPTGTGQVGGRNPDCPPGEREEVGRGSYTRRGRAAEGKPRRTAYRRAA